MTEKLDLWGVRRRAYAELLIKHCKQRTGADLSAPILSLEKLRERYSTPPTTEINGKPRNSET